MEYASNGKANAALTTGIIGTAGVGLGLLGAMGNNNGCGNNGGLFGGLFGGNNCNSGCHVTQTEQAYAVALASSEAKRYADQISREESNLIFLEARRQDEKLGSVIKDTTGALIEIGNALAVANTNVACLEKEVARNREEAKTYTDTRVDAEAQLRKCADENVVAWTEKQLCKKIDGELRLNPDILCAPNTGCNTCNY